MTLIDLSDFDTWLPERLLARPFEWKTEQPVVPLGDLGIIVAPDTIATVGTPVITPASIDSATGAVLSPSTKYQGSAYFLHDFGDGLAAGDLLVPLTSTAPVLRVTTDRLGSVCSSQFLGLKVPPRLSLWLWSVLNSTSGVQARSDAIAGLGGASRTRAALLSLTVPTPPFMFDSAAFSAIEDHTHVVNPFEADNGGSWWRTANLVDYEWRFVLATPTPEIVITGIPLADLATVERGVTPPREFCTDIPIPGANPLMTHSALSGRPPRTWIKPNAPHTVTANAGDIVLSGVADQPHAQVAPGPILIDRNLFLVRPNLPERGRTMAAYFNSQAGLGVRAILQTGTTARTLALRDLQRFPIPEQALESTELAHRAEDLENVDLAAKLENLLWS